MTRTTASPTVRVSPAPSTATAAPPAPGAPGPQAAAGTVLTSPGGTVLAECRAAGTYLVSWSPTQGYEASDVTRGPVAAARVVFESPAKSVTMTVTCPDGPGGLPVASSSSGSWGGGRRLSYRCFPAFSSTSRASRGQAWAARLAWSSSERGIAGETRTG